MNPPHSSDERHGPEDNPRRSIMALTLITGSCAAALPVLAVVVMVLSRSPQLDHGMNTALAFTIAIWLTLAAGALGVLVELTQPDSARTWPYLLPAPLILGGGVVAELDRNGTSAWSTRLMGNNPAACVTLLTLFSLPILTSVFYVLRGVVLTRPHYAGAAAGLLASSLTAAIYVWHCPGGSLLYVATWHGAAVLMVAVIGALLGRKYLRSSDKS